MRCVHIVALSLLCATALAAEPSAPATAPATQSAHAATPAAAAAPRPAPQATAPVRRSNDRIDLDTTVVTGNRELPKVLYIVPWKKAELGDLPSQPFNTLLDEVLTPVDRDVFRREVTYYDAIATEQKTSSPSSSVEPARSEK